MKKRGMTLAEILITLVIIGVLSAVIIPAANYAKPNDIKIGFLKNFDAITQAVSEMTSNSRVFPVCNDAGFCFEDFPLLNTDVVRENFEPGAPIQFAAGSGKFCRVLAFTFDVNNNNCSNAPIAAFPADRNNSWSFTTKTGESYRVLTRISQIDAVAGSNYLSEILVDVNGTNNGDNCMYSNACQNPDTFRFWVTADGDITPGDRAAEYYLRTRSNLKTKHIDVRNDNVNPPAPPSGDIAAEFITQPDNEEQD